MEQPEEDGAGGGARSSESDEEMQAFNTGPPQVGGTRVRHHGISLSSSRTAVSKLLGLQNRTAAYQQGVRVVGMLLYCATLMPDRLHHEGTMSEVYTFLTHLCLALHTYGAPAHRVGILVPSPLGMLTMFGHWPEYNMNIVAQHFGIQATFSALRTVIIICFGAEGEQKAQTHVFETDQGLDCDKLYMVDELCQRLADGDVSLTEGQQQLDEISKKPPRYNDIIKILCNGVAAASIAPLFFRSGWAGVGAAFVLGSITGIFLALGDRSPRFARVLELVCAIVASFLARVINDFMFPICVPGVVLGAVVWLLPGLALTIAMAELGTKNLISGTVRFFYGLVVTLELGMGIAIGSKLALWELQDDECVHLSDWYHLLWVPLFCTSANILLGTHPKHWPAMGTCAFIAYSVSFLTSKVINIGVESSSALSAVALGLFANAYYYFSRNPSIMLMLAGVLLLVPGSIGVRGVTAFVGERDAVSAITFTFQTIVITLSITVGIFIANLIAFPRPTLVYKIILE